MKKLVSLLLMLSLTFSAYAGNQWRAGTGASTIPGGTNISDIDTVSYQNIVAPIDRLLINYQEGCKITYLSASTLTVEAGEITVRNTDESISLQLRNSAATTVAWTEIDTGAEAASTTYYVYAYQATATDTDFDIVISTSSTIPTGITYYKRMGTFYNNSGSDIEQITNDNTYILIVTGNATNGGTIPLPSGYLESQCKWMVSPRVMSYSIGNGPAHPAIGFTVYADTRVIVSTDATGAAVTVNYIIVGYK